MSFEYVRHCRKPPSRNVPAGLFYQLDYLVKIVRRFDGRIAELPLFFLVVIDGNIRVFQRVARQHAGDSLICADDALGPQQLQPRHRCRRGRLTAKTVFAYNRLGVANLLVAYRPHDAVANIYRPQAFFQIDRP